MLELSPRDEGNYPGKGHSDLGKQVYKDTEVGDHQTVISQLLHSLHFRTKPSQY